MNVKEAQKKLLDSYEKAWREGTLQKPKLNTYCEVKEKMGAPSYLTANLCRKQRALLSRLHSGTLKLEIELGRYDKRPRCERICKLCDLEVEDTSHFLFRCVANKPARLEMYHKLPEILQIDIDTEKIKFLENYPYQYANFVNKLWQMCENMLNNCVKQP